MTMLLDLPISKKFNLEDVVCSHGFFMMAPNQWDPSSKTLERPLRLSDRTTSVIVRISQNTIKNPITGSPSLCLQVRGVNYLSLQDQQYLVAQVARMLRISEKDENDIAEFHKIHEHAKMKGFGRIFRSPNLFEDLVKTILLCNCQWGRSLEMARSLCELQLELKMKKGLKRKNDENVTSDGTGHVLEEIMSSYGDFPSSKELAIMKKKDLQKSCNLGYRASTILRLVEKIEKGDIKLEDIEQDQICENIYKKLMVINGFGTFVCSYALTWMGFYTKIPADSETVRHLKQFHGKKNCTTRTLKKDVEDVYKNFAPFQYLAYWSELWDSYEKECGKLSELPPTNYKNVTGIIFKKK